MPPLEKIKDALFGSSDAEQYHYECTTCFATFTDDERTVGAVACPNCGSHSVREQATPSENAA